jgi:hypothetical protein
MWELILKDAVILLSSVSVIEVDFAKVSLIDVEPSHPEKV